MKISFNDIYPLENCNYQRLSLFSVSNSNFTTIRDSCNISTLQLLKLENTSTYSLGPISNLINLKQLSLINVQMTHFSNFTLPNLQNLELSSESFIEVTGNTLDNITILTLDSSSIHEIDIGANCKQLQKVQIYNTNISINLSDHLYPALIHVKLVNTNITTIKIRSTLQVLEVISSRYTTDPLIL